LRYYIRHHPGKCGSRSPPQVDITGNPFLPASRPRVITYYVCPLFLTCEQLLLFPRFWGVDPWNHACSSLLFLGPASDCFLPPPPFIESDQRSPLVKRAYWPPNPFSPSGKVGTPPPSKEKLLSSFTLPPLKPDGLSLFLNPAHYGVASLFPGEGQGPAPLLSIKPLSPLLGFTHRNRPPLFFFRCSRSVMSSFLFICPEEPVPASFLSCKLASGRFVPLFFSYQNGPVFFSFSLS